MLLDGRVKSRHMQGRIDRLKSGGEMRQEQVEVWLTEDDLLKLDPKWNEGIRHMVGKIRVREDARRLLFERSNYVQARTAADFAKFMRLFADRVVERCKELNLTLATVSRAAGMSSGVCARYWKGLRTKSKPSWTSVITIARLVDIEITQVMREAGIE